MFIQTWKKGPIVTCIQNPNELPIQTFHRFLRLVFSKKLCKFQFRCAIWIVVSITPHPKSVMGLLWFAIMVQDIQVSALPVLRRRLQKWQRGSVVYSLWMLDDMVNKPILDFCKGVFFDKILGKTSSTDATDTDLSIDVLVADFCEMVQILFPDPSSNCPSFLVKHHILIRHWIFVDCFLKLVGHSMGASVVVRSCPRLIEKKYRVVGVVVLDVVEGNCTLSTIFLKSDSFIL